MYYLIAFAVLFGASLAYDCGDAPHINGCSVWGIVPYKKYFASQCNKHDVCYTCGSKFGISKNSCEDAFLADLYDRCTNWWCNTWAWTYYKAVKWFGSGYNRVSPSWCTQSRYAWIKENCLP